MGILLIGGRPEARTVLRMTALKATVRWASRGANSTAVSTRRRGCNLSLDPNLSPTRVDDNIGVFVDATNGSDTNNGSKLKPFQSIAKAITANAGLKPRVYVCAGSYTDNVLIDQAHAVSIYGGFACGAWTYATTNAAIVKPRELLCVTGVGRDERGGFRRHGVRRARRMLACGELGATSSPSNAGKRSRRGILANVSESIKGDATA